MVNQSSSQKRRNKISVRNKCVCVCFFFVKVFGSVSSDIACLRKNTDSKCKNNPYISKLWVSALNLMTSAC